MKKINKILYLFSFLAIIACTGTRQYFNAAEKLEKQGLIDDAANYYLESLQRKNTNVSARAKLAEVGQKHVSNLSSEFFRNNSTGKLEASLDSYERMKAFLNKAAALNVNFDYPKTYDDDYKAAVDAYCSKNYDAAYNLVNKGKFESAGKYISNVKKYNASYKTIQNLDNTAVCEPLYQNAITYIQNKDYYNASGLLKSINQKTDNYKDSKDLTELVNSQLDKSFMLFEPKSTSNKGEKEIEDLLFNNFSQAATQKLNHIKVINNTPFTSMGNAQDISAVGNIDLIQAIRKATGTDFFYIFDIYNRVESTPPIQKSFNKAFQEVQIKQPDNSFKYSYNEVPYNYVKASRAFSYNFRYKVINAYSNQIVNSQDQQISAQDNIEYNEFQYQYNNNINSLYPYNPQNTLPMYQTNPRNWRQLFSASKTLKSFNDLQNDAYNTNVNQFVNSIINSIK
ncbi:MAG: hypothetical protein JSU07_03260 [Bacteroidetes bacterium]|nr:hypothetical protein [Bacteroidota bacterium]